MPNASDCPSLGFTLGTFSAFLGTIFCWDESSQHSQSSAYLLHPTLASNHLTKAIHKVRRQSQEWIRPWKHLRIQRQLKTSAPNLRLGKCWSFYMPEHTSKKQIASDCRGTGTSHRSLVPEKHRDGKQFVRMQAHWGTSRLACGIKVDAAINWSILWGKCDNQFIRSFQVYKGSLNSYY